MADGGVSTQQDSGGKHRGLEVLRDAPLHRFEAGFPVVLKDLGEPTAIITVHGELT